MTLDELRRHPRPLLSVAETAETLGIARSTLYDLIARNAFPVAAVRMGQRIFLPTTRLVALLEGQPDDEVARRRTALG